MSVLLTFIPVISLLILVHEFGHLIAAKLTGMKVEEFGLGMGPRLLKVWNDGETVYTINALPIGGYVKILGEDSIPENEKERSFSSKPLWARALVLSAGIFMNYVLALVLIFGLLTFAGEPTLQVVLPISSITESSPLNDTLTTDKMVIVGYKDQDGIAHTLQSDMEFIDYVKENAGTSVSLLLLEDGADIANTPTEITVIPRKNPPSDEGALGIVIEPTPDSYFMNYTEVKPLQILPKTFSITHNLLKAMVVGMYDMFSNLFLHGVVPSDIAGPVGIAKLTDQAAKQGLSYLTQFTALISLNLAVLNLLPIPALDGGRLFFVLIELVTRKKVPQKIEGWLHTIGLLLLFALLALVSIVDIKRFF
ncbi:hypothetical protein GW793_02035 [bacterium]|uniref:Peptidase M50 domain-containing protein n=2 Tax=Katanobacteria TaxID=422282 RepID=A0A2M7WZP7_UNCKA|nr:hypothetical protein [bacterium]PIP56096.1 MAG: hypothetical protein COX05_04825 [candidate division WWE3 bacterium CG22_combo_CG10-13_8_21_14_all_39_12]PJA39099.1 MAG: hypothetical protein CO179_05875 [candidate division WWE3 bacterium CG_4_9_14_3_um_filter_39_7]